MTFTSSQTVFIDHLADRLGDLGAYALRQFARDLVRRSSGNLDLLERYSVLPADLVNAFGVTAPSLWLVK